MSDAGLPYVEATTLGDLLLRAADATPAADALVIPGHRLSYEKLLQRVVLTARSLVSLGVGRGASHLQERSG